jgi:hypothetical protein
MLHHNVNICCQLLNRPVDKFKTVKEARECAKFGLLIYVNTEVWKASVHDHGLHFGQELRWIVANRHSIPYFI